MATTTPVQGISLARTARAPQRLMTALEIFVVYSGILFYIWRWQFSHPLAWVPLAAVILSSHIVRRDQLRQLGLTTAELLGSARWVLPLALAIYVPLLIYGFGWQHLVFAPPPRSALGSFGAYFVWCAFQQYLTQSYFHNRLRSVIRNTHLSSFLVGLMFGGAHIPNPILMVVTALGGVLLAEIFAHHRNIWPLALAQAAGGVLIGALSPASLIHNMRVGPGYFFYGIR